MLDEIFAAIEATSLASKPAPVSTLSVESVVPVDLTEVLSKDDLLAATSVTGKRRRSALKGEPELDKEEEEISTFKLKAGIIEMLRDSPGGRLKETALRQVVCEAALKARKFLTVEEAEISFEKGLKKLIKKGTISKDGKYCEASS